MRTLICIVLVLHLVWVTSANSHSHRNESERFFRNSSCVLSEENVLGIQAKIGDIFSLLGSPDSYEINPISCKLTDYNSTIVDCKNLFQLWQCGVAKLSQAITIDNFYQKLSKSTSALRLALDKLDAVSKQSGQMKRELEDYRLGEIELLELSMRTLRLSVGTNEKWIDTAPIVIVSYIQRGELDDIPNILEAIDCYDWTIRFIVEQSFQYAGNETNIDNLLAFIEVVPSCDLKERAYEYLIETILDHQLLVSTQMHSLAQAIRGSECPLVPLRRDLRTQFGDDYGTGSPNQSIQGYASMFQFQREGWRSDIRDAMNGTMERAELVLDSMELFPSDDLGQAIGYLAVFEEMRRLDDDKFSSRHFLTLAYRLDQLSRGAGAEFPPEVRQELKDALEQFPEQIRTLLFQPFFKIKSGLYGANLGLVSSTSGPQIFACVSIRNDFHTKWYIDGTIRDGKYFILRNAAINGSLCSAFDSEDLSFVPDEAVQNDRAIEWEVHPVEQAARLYFKNRATGRILHVLSDSKQARKPNCIPVQEINYGKLSGGEVWEVY